MNFDAEELKYLNHVLRSTSSYIIAQGRESVAPSVNHYKFCLLYTSDAADEL